MRRSTVGTDSGLAAAKVAGPVIKINAVTLKGVNEDEIEDLIRWAHGEGMDLTLIETMPLGDIEGDRTDQLAEELPTCEVIERVRRMSESDLKADPRTC